MTARAFRDRKDAGQLLGGRLAGRGYVQSVVLALSPGGAVVGAQIARALDARFDTLLWCALTPRALPEPELGVLLDGEAAVLDEVRVHAAGIGSQALASLLHEQQEELERRGLRLRGGRAHAELAGRTVIVADDGCTPLAALRAALRCVRQKGPRRVVLAQPVVRLERAADVDELVFLLTCNAERDPCDQFEAFEEVSESDAAALLRAASPPSGR